VTQKIELYDTTLRDGTQSEDISLAMDDKIKIAHKLDELGIHYIEGGWPGSNPKDADFFEKAKSHKFKSSKITAFGSTCHAEIPPERDKNIALSVRNIPRVTTTGIRGLNTYLVASHSRVVITRDALPHLQAWMEKIS